MRHIASVLTVNAGAICIAVENLNGVLTMISLILAISYTLYRFHKDIKTK